MATLSRTAGGRWIVRWYDSAGDRRTRTIPDRRTGELLAAEIVRARALGRDWTPETERAPAPAAALEDLVAAYVTECGRLQAASTARIKRLQLGGFLDWLDTTGVPPVAASLSKVLLSDYYASLSDHAPSTRRKYVAAVQQAWRWAAEDDAWGPLVPRLRTLAMPAVPRKRTIAPTWAEMDAVVRACLDETPGRGPRAANVPLYRLAVVLRFTGLRVAQACALTWADVDLDRATLRIRPELGKSASERTGRVVPISSHLVQVLTGWGRREGPLVPWPREGRPGKHVARQRDMGRAWARAGVRAEAWEGQTHHAFRKGFVSGLHRLGAESDAVEYLVGHSLGLRGVYTDPEALRLRDAVALIPPLTGGIATGSLDEARIRKSGKERGV